MGDGALAEAAAWVGVGRPPTTWGGFWMSPLHRARAGTLPGVVPRQGRPTPAYRELADELRAAIERSGAEVQLPTEAELTRRHGLSRQTVRRAYQDLVADGVVRRVPGRGTFPVPPGAYTRSFGSLEDLLAQLKDTELELVQPLGTAGQPYQGAAAKLRTSEIMEVRYRRLRQGLPYSFNIASLPHHVGMLLSRVRVLKTPGARRRTTLLELLDGVLEPRITLARQDITVDVTPPDVAPLIDMPPREPVLRIDRVFFDRDHRPVHYAVAYLNPDRYSYQLELRRTQ